MKEHFCPVEQSVITYEGKCNWCGENEGSMTEPFAWFRYQQGSRVYYDSKKWDDCQPLYTHSDYEHGFIDGMQKQMQSSVDKAVNRMAQRTWVGLTDEEFHEACWESYVDPVTGECSTGDREYAVRWTEAKLKEKNT